MKKYLLVAGLISICSLIKAQERKMKSEMGKALYGGANVATLPGDDNYNGSVIGIQAGAGINVANLSKEWDMRTELLFSQQGGKSSYGSDTYGGKSVLKLSYINLPVLAHYQSNSGFFAEAGLQPGLLVGAKKKSSFTGPGGGQEPSTTDVKKDLNSFSLGVPVGAGYVFKKKVGVGVRVVPGLLSINKNGGEGSSPKNFVLSARLSYFL